MSRVVEIIPGQSRTVKISPNSVPVVSVSEKGSNQVSVSSSVNINVVQSTGESTDLISQEIVVTNKDEALGEAVDTTYEVGTPVETILRDILVPQRAPTISLTAVVRDLRVAPDFDGTILDGTFITVTDEMTVEVNQPFHISALLVTINDIDDLILDDQDLLLTFSFFPNQVVTIPKPSGVDSWSDASYPLALSVPVDFPIVDLPTDKEDVSYREETVFAKMNYRRKGRVFTVESNTITFKVTRVIPVYNARFRLDTESDLDGIPISSTPDEATAVSGTVSGQYVNRFQIFDRNPVNIVTPSTPFDDLNLVEDIEHEYFTHLMIPDNYNLNLADPNTISQSGFGVSSAFEFIGYIRGNPIVQNFPTQQIITGPLYKVFATRAIGAFPIFTQLQITLGNLQSV
jgi:hypothetical protein